MRLAKMLMILGILLILGGCQMPGQCAPSPSETATVPTVVAEQTQADPTVAPATEPAQIQVSEPLPTEAVPLIQPTPNDGDFVRVLDHIPDISVELLYGTEENFTGQRIYEFSDVWLRYGTVKKLALVQEELREKGLSLKIWDGYRPKTAQQKLWEICPDPAFVSDPNKGTNSHCRGIAVDVTLVDQEGQELVMPTGFDDFSALADRDYSDCSAEAAENAEYLEELMSRYGFKPYQKEWWHFADTQEYPLAEDFEPMMSTRYAAQCEEYISLRTAADTSADVITKIPAGEEVLALARNGGFLYVEYQGVCGYVLERFTIPLS